MKNRDELAIFPFTEEKDKGTIGNTIPAAMLQPLGDGYSR
jgi:hypothetical protein